MSDFTPEGTTKRREPVRETPSRAEQVSAQRRRRQDTGPLQGLKLHVPDGLKEEGYEYRWFNDKDGGGRLHNKTVLDDWDIVKTKDIDGQGEGTPVTRNVGKMENGQTLKAYLCRKPKEWFDGDRAKAQARITEQENSLKRGVVNDPKGLSGESAYVPAGGISIDRGR